MSDGGRLYVVGAQFDEHRNTSRVFPVEPNALPNALHALETFARQHPEHARWITDGAPPLTDDEHVARFGEPYKRGKR